MMTTPVIVMKYVWDITKWLLFRTVEGQRGSTSKLALGSEFFKIVIPDQEPKEKRKHH